MHLHEQYDFVFLAWIQVDACNGITPNCQNTEVDKSISRVPHVFNLLYQINTW